MIIRRKRREKQQKQKWKFRGEEFLGPQASLRVTPCPQAPNHTRGEVIRPPSQIENNSYSVIRTRDLDDLSCTRCAPTIAARPSRNYTFNKHELSVWWDLKYQVGGEGEELCVTESAIERFRSRIKEMNHTKNWQKRSTRGILAYVVMADGFVCWSSLIWFLGIALHIFYCA